MAPDSRCLLMQILGSSRSGSGSVSLHSGKSGFSNQKLPGLSLGMANIYRSETGWSPLLICLKKNYRKFRIKDGYLKIKDTVIIDTVII